MGLLTVTCSPTQNTVVAIATFQAYSPMPVPILFLSLTTEPVPAAGLRMPAGILTTFGSILSKAFSGSFIAYFATSVVAPAGDCPKRGTPRTDRSPTLNNSWIVGPLDGQSLMLAWSPAFSKSFRCILLKRRVRQKLYG